MDLVVQDATPHRVTVSIAELVTIGLVGAWERHVDGVSLSERGMSTIRGARWHGEVWQIEGRRSPHIKLGWAT